MNDILMILAHDESVLHWHIGELVVHLSVALAIVIGIGAFLFRKSVVHWLAGMAGKEQR
ncbi:MAG: hypothetical protein WD118_06535 [Phycisphaeraceae bacterium]